MVNRQNARWAQAVYENWSSKERMARESNARDRTADESVALFADLCDLCAGLAGSPVTTADRPDLALYYERLFRLEAWRMSCER
jgi:hypothetical protein